MITFDDDGRPRSECAHTVTDVRRRTFSNGATHVVLQCLTCGHQVRAVGRDDPRRRGGATADPFDERLLERWNAELNQAWAEYRQKKDEVYRQEQEDLREAYAQYLESDQWKQKRAKRMALDEGRCQAVLDGCRGMASQVHHLTYVHFGDEPLFDLVSVCRPCHEKISIMEGRMHAKKIA